jgi:hypothetical protein
LKISSEIELPGVMETKSNDESDVKILRGKVNIKVSDNEIYESSNYKVENEDVYLWWKNIGKVKITAGNQINVDVENSNLIIPYLLGPVMAILLHQKGLLVLHGSSVKINDSAIVFLGHRGIGKSTTAINLYKKGYPLITDDILAINFDDKCIPHIYPGYLHVRLSEDAYNHIKDDTNILTPIRTIVGKLFCDASYGYSPKSLELKKIYFLEKGDQTRISTLNSQETLIDLISHSTANRIFKEDDQVNNLTQCVNMINNINFNRLEFTHSFKNISELISLIENDL